MSPPCAPAAGEGAAEAPAPPVDGVAPPCAAICAVSFGLPDSSGISSDSRKLGKTSQGLEVSNFLYSCDISSGSTTTRFTSSSYRTYQKKHSFGSSANNSSKILSSGAYYHSIELRTCATWESNLAELSNWRTLPDITLRTCASWGNPITPPFLLCNSSEQK